MKEWLKLDNLRTDHVTIRSELRYLIGAKIVDLKCRVFGENPVQRSGSGSEPDPEPNRDFGPVAKTTQHTELLLNEVARSYITVCNSFIFGTGQFCRSMWQEVHHIKHRQFSMRTAQLSPPILIRQYRAWCVKYAAFHGASFGRPAIFDILKTQHAVVQNHHFLT